MAIQTERAMNNSKLEALREVMVNSNIDACIIPITDPHLGEYVPSRWRIIEWLTGFTGSAANVVVTKDFAGLWTDSRYFIQAANELNGSGFELVKLTISHTPEYIDWIVENLPASTNIAVDGRVIPIGTVNKLVSAIGRKSMNLRLDIDLISDIWVGRPDMPLDKVFEHDILFTGASRDDKIARVREKMKDMRVKYHLITSLDDIAWLLNIRGNDITYSPLVTAFVLVTPEYLNLYIDDHKIPSLIKDDLTRCGIRIYPYNQLVKSLASIEPDSSVLITPSATSALHYQSIPDSVEIIEEVAIPTRLKAIKNRVEIDHIYRVMIKDGVALTRFFYWLDHSLGKEKITEISASEKLLSFRLEQENCVGPSFATIAGYNEHGASPHYCSTVETDVELKREGIFLLDSGGQYYDGTTDVTRTIALGKPTQQQRIDFTLALKGTIGLAMVKFPLGTKGFQIEVLARKALWDYGLNYGHGTGHGVGFFLNVHEGPQTIGTGASGDLKTVIEPGMLTADEPAIYREGEYGFRTENLILCVEDEKTEYGQFLKFDTVTLCYIDRSLVEVDLLTEEEREWLNSYHEKVYKKLSPELSKDEAAWLDNKTSPIY